MKCPECKKELGKAVEIDIYHKGWCCPACDIKIYKFVDVVKMKRDILEGFDKVGSSGIKTRKAVIALYKEKYGDTLDKLPVERYNRQTILKALNYTVELKENK